MTSLVAVFVAQQLVFDELLHDLVTAAMFEPRYGRHQGAGNQLVILHSHLHLQ